uniref:Uncharacterized protein n=1 Tax=Amphimedon queenslandica TaxID=400682 RepID=A0A1X7VR83_AMPQE
MPPPNIAHDKRSRPSDNKDYSCPKKPPDVNNSGNNNNDGNNNTQGADFLVDEAKTGPRPLTTNCYDPTITWSNWVYNAVGMDWPRGTC